jgi:hypothetical protein
MEFVLADGLREGNGQNGLGLYDLILRAPADVASVLTVSSRRRDARTGAIIFCYALIRENANALKAIASHSKIARPFQAVAKVKYFFSSAAAGAVHTAHTPPPWPHTS